MNVSPHIRIVLHGYADAHTISSHIPCKKEVVDWQDICSNINNDTDFYFVIPATLNNPLDVIDPVSQLQMSKE